MAVIRILPEKHAELTDTSVAQTVKERKMSPTKVFLNRSETTQILYVRRLAISHLAPLQLKEVVEIVGVEGRAQVRRCGRLAEAEIRVRGVRFGSEGVERAGLVGVLQGQIDPVEELRGLVHGGTRIYGRQQAHLSIQMAQLDFPPLTLGLLSTLFLLVVLGRWQVLLFVSSPKGPSPPHTGSLGPLERYSRVIALTCHFLKVRPAPHGPLSAFIAAGLREARRICDEGSATSHGRRPISILFS